jgi:hypothetical protein
VPTGAQSEYFQTTERTLAKYGADVDLGLQIDIAEVMGLRDDWRRNHEADARRIAVAAAARAARAAKLSRPMKALSAPEAASKTLSRDPVPAAAIAATAGREVSSVVQALLADAERDFVAVREAASRAAGAPRRGKRGRRSVRPWPGRAGRGRRR